MSETVQTTYIEIHQNRRGQATPCILGTRVAVTDVFIHHELMGKTPDQIIEVFPHLTLSQVHAALAYAFDHIDEIRKLMKQQDAFIEGMRAQLGSGPLHAKLSDMDANGDSVSS